MKAERSYDRDDYITVASVKDVAPGGMITVALGERCLIIANTGEGIYAVAGRCGHMSAPLDMGTLDGTIATCPMHHVQFDVTTGEALSPVVPHDFSGPAPPAELATYLQRIAELMNHIDVCNIATHPVLVRGDSIQVAPFY